MAKKTIKSPTVAKVLNAFEVALRTNAENCAGADQGDLAVEFAALFSPLLDNYAEFELARKAWVTYYCAYMGDAKTTAANQAFSYRMKACGFEKPKNDNAEAKRKRAERAAKKASEASTAGDTDETTAKDGTGAASATKVKMELTAIEAHLLAMFRAGKFEMCNEFIASQATKAALV